MMKILEGSGAAVVPVCVDGMWGSIFSFERGKFFWKRPRRLPYPVSIYFGQPIHQPRDAFQVRQALQDLGATAMDRRRQTLISVSDAVVRSCKRRKFRSKVADSSGVDLTGGTVLARSLILRRLLRRNVFVSAPTHVGILLPPTAAAVLANMAITLDRRVAVNLNYTVVVRRAQRVHRAGGNRTRPDQPQVHGEDGVRRRCRIWSTWRICGNM